ncbi:MAG TPA: hypothetical protein VH020_16320 [Stellaceae bacterium]|jgi:hypothetical protein|nr:hypothetical protein [Stellaceae bacterium]
MLRALPARLLARRGLWHLAFIGGLGLSAIVIVALFFVAYFAGTAPHVPRSAAALETLEPPGDSWVAPVQAKPLDNAASAKPTHAAPTKLSALPHAADPPIDISDLPPPEHTAP